MADKQKTDVQENAENQELETGVPTNKLTAMIQGWSTQQRIIALLAACGTVFLVLHFIAIRPLTNYRKKIENQIHESKAMIPEKLKVLKEKESIWKDRESLRDYWTSATLSREEEIAEFLRTIESVSQRNNLFVSNINPVQVNSKEGDLTYQLSVVLEGAGSVPSVKQFIADLERSNAPIRVESVNLRSQGAGETDLRYKFSVVKLGVQLPG